jgi:hypothetical protein
VFFFDSKITKPYGKILQTGYVGKSVINITEHIGKKFKTYTAHLREVPRVHGKWFSNQGQKNKAKN